MTINKFKLGIITVILLIFTFSACKKDKPVAPEPEENELITRVSFKLTNTSNASDISTVTWTDPDGEGGASPSIGVLILKPNTTYNFEVLEVLNETEEGDERNVLNEIIEESDEHLWVYKVQPASILTLIRTDKDANNFEIGLKGTVTTGIAATGNLRTILRHQPDVKNGSEAPGSSDFDATFQVKIE